MVRFGGKLVLMKKLFFFAGNFYLPWKLDFWWESKQTWFFRFWGKTRFHNFTEKLDFAFLATKLNLVVLMENWIRFSLVLAENSILSFWQKTRFCNFGKKNWFCAFGKIIRFYGFGKKIWFCRKTCLFFAEIFVFLFCEIKTKFVVLKWKLDYAIWWKNITEQILIYIFKYCIKIV